MALTKTQKADKVQAFAGELEHSTSAIIGTFKALTAAKDFDLRKTVRAAGGSSRPVVMPAALEKTKQERECVRGAKTVAIVARVWRAPNNRA